MANSLMCYFDNIGGATKALKKYAEVAHERRWPITHKLYLYRIAGEAFNHDGRQQGLEKFTTIYNDLRGSWQVFRRATRAWNEKETYHALMKRCRSTSRSAGLTLKSNLQEESAVKILKQYLEAMQDLKVLTYPTYPIMPVAKFSHFFNPRLFPIYDTAVINQKVLRGKFKEEWSDFEPVGPLSFAAGAKEGIDVAFRWILWGGQMICAATRSVMALFADWFINECKKAGKPADDLHGELFTYYATAFEFIAIGAAHCDG